MFELVLCKITHEHMKQLILSGFQILPNWEKLLILWNNYFINEKKKTFNRTSQGFSYKTKAEDCSAYLRNGSSISPNKIYFK